MAMTFNAEGCRTAATDLKNSSDELNRLLNTELNGIIEKVKKVYQSSTADELYGAFDKMKAKFPDFVSAINDCSTYLSDVVAPAYEQVESQVASQIQ